MTSKSKTNDRPPRKAAAKPGTVKAGTGHIKTLNPEAKKRKQTGGGELLKTPIEMARLGGFSKRTLERLAKAKLVPVIRIGRLCFYDPARVMAALQRNLEVKEVQP
jgi:hypothetical protein